MKSYALTALAAFVSAQQTETDGPVTTIPVASDRAFSSTGYIGEYWREDAASDEQTIWLWAQWDNGVTDMNFPNGSLIQNYAQWSSTTEPGKFDGVTCSVLTDKSEGTANVITIRNIAESESLTIADGKQSGTWDQIGTEATELDQFEQETDPANTAEFYGRTYKKNKFSTQKCGAIAMMYYSINGEDVEGLEEVNEAYWGIKNAGSVTFSTGFRVWEDPSDAETWAQGDAEQVSWSAHDWGLEDPNAVVIVPDDLDMDSDSGASALMATAALLAASAFMF